MEGGIETQEGGDTGLYVYISPIHFVIQQKRTQHCKAIIPQEKKKENNVATSTFFLLGLS